MTYHFNIIERFKRFYRRRYVNYNLESSLFLAKSTTFFLIITIAGSIIWLAQAKTEQIVIARGKLIPRGSVKEIRAPENGVITQILVEEGETVRKGQELLLLDRQASTSRVNNLNMVIKNLGSQITKKREEYLSTLLVQSDKISVLDIRLDMLKDRQKSMEYLRAQGAISKMDLLELKDRIVMLSGDKSELLLENRQIQKRYEQDVTELENQLISAKTDLADAQEQNRYKTIKSPVDGIIFELKPTSIGFAAQNREPILKVVPSTKLYAEVEVPSNQIGFIKQKDSADINVESFPASDFGTIEGFISQIGSDSLEPDRVNRVEFMYPVQISLNKQYIELEKDRIKKKLHLQPGMTVTAHIKLRHTTYLNLLLSELKSKVSSLREI